MIRLCSPFSIPRAPSEGYFSKKGKSPRSSGPEPAASAGGRSRGPWAPFRAGELAACQAAFILPCLLRQVRCSIIKAKYAPLTDSAEYREGRLKKQVVNW